MAINVETDGNDKYSAGVTIELAEDESAHGQVDFSLADQPSENVLRQNVEGLPNIWICGIK